MLLLKEQAPQSAYDVIVVGGGLGGMTVANILGRNGRKVLLLEAHNKLGGLATWFKRKPGHVFDVSLHGFPWGMLKTCKRYWNNAISDLIIPLKRVRFVNPQYKIETDFTETDFTRILIEHFQVSAEAVTAFFSATRGLTPHDDHQLTVREHFQKFFPDRNDVYRFLLEPITYANGHTLEDPAVSYGIVFSNFMKKGVYTFACGTDHLIGLMKEELLKNGVDIKMHSKVQKIVTEKSQVTGVLVNDQFIQAPVCVSNANLKATLFHLVGPEFLAPAYAEAASQVRLNTSSAQVYMGIKAGEELPNLGDLLFISGANSFSTDELLDLNTQSRTFSFYYSETHGPGKGAIVSSTNARFDDWMKLSPEEYQMQKTKMIEDTLRDLEKFLPGVRDKIDFIDAATPKTIMRYTHHPEGTSFGTKFEGLKVGLDLPSQIHGLYHCGSVGIIMSGWLGAANYGAIVANEIERHHQCV